MTPRLASLLAPTAFAIALTGCGGEGPAPAASSGASTPPAPGELTEGAPAPAATLLLHDGKKVELASLAGKQVLLYFYPKDDTRGCTIEAQGLRDAFGDLEAAGVVVYGVSLQDAASHQAFIDKHALPFPLVVDEGGALAKAFGVPVTGEYAARHSFLIGKDGKLKRIWREVDPARHAADVLAAAKS